MRIDTQCICFPQTIIWWSWLATPSLFHIGIFFNTDLLSYESSIKQIPQNLVSVKSSNIDYGAPIRFGWSDDCNHPHNGDDDNDPHDGDDDNDPHCKRGDDDEPW